MIVNELASKADIPAHVVRYYTRIGLLKPKRHAENGYRIFGAEDVRTLHFIRNAKELGFTLGEISKFLESLAEGDSPGPEVRDLLENHIEKNRTEISKLQRLQKHMEETLRRWRDLSDRQLNAEILHPLIGSGGYKTLIRHENQ